MKNMLPAPNEPETWMMRVRGFFWRHEAIETLAIWLGIWGAIGAAGIGYLLANEAIETASRALGVG